MLCGCAATRAESLWLSVKPTPLLAATPPRQSLSFSTRRTESQRLSARVAAQPQTKLIDGSTWFPFHHPLDVFFRAGLESTHAASTEAAQFQLRFSLT